MPYILALILIDIIVLLTNYTPDTWLVGWDNVMPELNLMLNFKRALFSLWQDYRGLGLVDGMAHSANLMHTFYIAILSFILPTSMLRYVFIMLTHLIGGIGMYWLGQKLTKQKAPAFLAALFYMFNLGIIQMYFAPLEVFAVHFAALPLIVLTLIRALEKPTYNRLGIFFLVSFLLTPQSFVPTVFIAFCVLFGSIVAYDFFLRRNIRTTIWIISLFFIANSFWLLPYVYSIKYSAPEIPKTKINQYASEEIYYRNKEYGTLGKVLSLKGFMLSTPEIDIQTNTYIPFLAVWEKHSSRPLYMGIYAILFTIGVAGVWYGLRKKEWILVPVGISWLTAFFFLANNTFLLDTLNIWVRETFPLIGEAFRFPFTKFITLFAFCFSIFFAYGITFVTSLLPHKKIVQNISVTVGTLFILYLAFPLFGGQFFSPLLRLAIPNDYFQTIEYFKNIDPDKRIAVLPAETFWNWEYRSWGHRGSGFLWYGIAQPLLIRPFDPWSTKNEQFYNELHYAMQKRDRDMFDDVLRKYSVEYLVLDKSVINAGKPKAIDYDKIESFLNNSLSTHVTQSYNMIDIYHVDNPPITNDISILNNPPRANPVSQFHYEDTAFRTYGSYISDTEQPNDIYPFTGLFSEKTQNDIELNVTMNNRTITITPKNQLLSEKSQNNQYYLQIPATKEDALIPVRVELRGDRVVFTGLNPQIMVGSTTYELPEKSIEIPFSKIHSPSRIEFTDSGQVAKNADAAFLLRDITNTIKVVKGTDSELISVNAYPLFLDALNVPVQLNPTDTISVQLAKVASAGSIEKPFAKREFSIIDKKYLPVDDTVVYVTSDKTNTEVVMWNENMLHNTGYIMTIQSSWNYGLPLIFYVDNPYEKRAEIDTLLSKETNVTNTIFMPPVDPYHHGYGIHFIAKTLGGITSETVLHDFNAYPIPYNFLSHIHLKRDSSVPVQTIHTVPYEATRVYPYLYRVTADTKLGDYIYLDQAYQEGWIAAYDCKFWILGCKFLEHVKINNWANGFRLPDDTTHTTYYQQPTTFTILFWPQYLEFAEFWLATLTAIFFVIKYYNAENRNKFIHKIHRTVENIIHYLTILNK